MIQCTNLSNLGDCNRMSLSGIKGIQLIPFGDIYDYTYTNDNLNIVTGYKLSIIPTTLTTNPATNFLGDLLIGSVSNMRHTLTTVLPIIEQEKRNELEKMLNIDLTIIFTDKNNKCWIIGQDYPVKVEAYSVTTGASKSDGNVYNITFSGTSKYQARQIACYDGECFASFDGFPYFQSAFLIEDASTLDWSSGINLGITDGTTVFSYNTTALMIPTDWDTSGSQRLADAIQFNNLIGNSATSQVSQLIYDGGSDQAIIVFSSSTTSFNSLTINGGTAIGSAVSIELNLVMTIAAPLNNPATTITVTDSDLNVVYSGYPSEFLGSDYTGVSGFVNNATINVSELYESGTTFTATIEGLDCGTREYIFEYEPLENCTVSTSISYDYSNKYDILIPKNENFNLDYQKVTLFYDEYQYDIVPDIRFATSSFSVMEAAILVALTADPSSPIIASTIQITDGLAGVGVSFYSLRNDSSFFCHYLKSNDNLEYSFQRQEGTMRIVTTAPATSILTLTDATTSKVATGSYGSAPTFCDYQTEDDITGLEPWQMSTLEIRSEGALGETTVFDMAVSSPSCPTTSNPIDTVVCFEDSPLAISRKYERYVADVSYLSSPIVTGAFVFDYNIGATNYTLGVITPANLDGAVNTDNLGVTLVNTLPLHLGESPIKVLNFYFDYYNWVYVMELDCSIDVVINSIEGNDLTDTVITYVFDQEYDITECHFDPIINPHTNIEWSFEDIDANTVAFNGEASTGFYRFRNSGFESVGTFHYDSGLNQVTVSTGINPAGNYTFTAWDVSFNVLQQFTLTAPTLTDVYGMGVAIANVKWISVENGFGLWQYCEFDSSTQSDTDVDILQNKLDRNIWCMANNWKALTPTLFTPVPVINSLLCP